MKLFKRITAAMLLFTAIAFTLVGCAAGASSGCADGEISVFYYTFSDAYISTVRSAIMTQTETKQRKPSRCKPRWQKALKCL